MQQLARVAIILQDTSSAVMHHQQRVVEVNTKIVKGKYGQA